MQQSPSDQDCPQPLGPDGKQQFGAQLNQPSRSATGKTGCAGAMVERGKTKGVATEHPHAMRFPHMFDDLLIGLPPFDPPARQCPAFRR